MSDMGLLEAQAHGTDEALQLGGLARKVVAHKRGLGDHTLPGILLALAGLDRAEGFVLCNTTHLGQRDRIAGRLVLAALLDCR